MPSKVPAPPIEATGAPSPRDFVEIGQVGADQGAEPAADIGERRRFLARQHHRDDGGHNDRHEDRHRNAEAGNRIGEPMDHQSDDGRRQSALSPIMHA